MREEIQYTMDIKTDHKFIYERNNPLAEDSVWSCLSKKEMKQKYPAGGYKILGEVTRKKGADKDFVIVHDYNDNKLYLQPPGSYPPLIYRIYGYIPIRDDLYVAVKKKNTIAGATILLAAIVLLTVGMNMKKTEPKQESLIDPSAQKYETNLERPKDWEQTRILLPAYTDLTMKADTDEIYVALYNPEDNPCYFRFTIILDGEKEEELFKTELVPPGQAVTKVTLPRKFEKGEYPITIRINSYLLTDSEKEVNGGEIKTKLIALEE